MVKKVFFFYFIFNLFNFLLAENPYEIKAIVNNNSITKIDIKNEINIILILNPKKKITNLQYIALNNLIEETLKNEEINKEKLKVDDIIINQFFLQLVNNLDLKEIEIDKNIASLIKKKIKINKLWNDLIIQKYGWKININMNEIEEKMKKNLNKNDNLNTIKEKLILEEKNKKISVFSKYHFNLLKKKSLIKFF